MKCPLCGKDVILQQKQVGTTENGEPIMNQYAICKDCKKQWNLDKQRAKKMAAKKAVEDVKQAESTRSDEEKKAVKKARPVTERTHLRSAALSTKTELLRSVAG